MLDLIIGKSEEEARHLADLFLRMIKGEAGENEIEELEEAGALVDVSICRRVSNARCWMAYEWKRCCDKENEK